MVWDRSVELRINLTKDSTEVIISGLHVEFNIERSRTFSENTAEFVVYNASSDTRKKLLRNDNTVVFSAGYEDDETGVMFVGNISEAYSVRIGADWVTTIQAVSARDENTALSAVNVSLSYSDDSDLLPVIEELASATNLALFGKENLSGIKVGKGFVHAGSFRNALAIVLPILEAEGLSTYIDNSEIVIYKVGEQSSRFSVVNFTYENGLKSVSDITEQTKDGSDPKKRIEFNSVIIPSIQPNSVINIKNTEHDGTFIVDRLKISGDNFGGDFSITGEAEE